MTEKSLKPQKTIKFKQARFIIVDPLISEQLGEFNDHWDWHANEHRQYEDDILFPSKGWVDFLA
jgi:hypothetical protein